MRSTSTQDGSLSASMRVLALGGAGCSDAELLGMLLDGGRGGADATRLARVLLAETTYLSELDRIEPLRLARRLGRTGRRRTVMIRAALELGRRAATCVLPASRPIHSPAHVHAHFRGRLPQLDREVFWVLLLDGRSRVQTELRISEGTLTAALVHPRDVFGPALRAGAAAVVLVHNHPSGDPEPSREDVELTERLVRAGDLVGIRVLDHVVVAQGGWASVCDRLGP